MLDVRAEWIANSDPTVSHISYLVWSAALSPHLSHTPPTPHLPLVTIAWPTFGLAQKYKHFVLSGKNDYPFHNNKKYCSEFLFDFSVAQQLCRPVCV